MQTISDVDSLPEFQNMDDEEEEFDDDEFEPDEEDDEEEPEDDPALSAKDLSIDDILLVDDTADEKIYIPEWGGNVTVKALTMNEFNQIRRMSKGKNVRTKSDSQRIVERETFLAGVVSPRIDRVKYEILLERNAGVIIRIMNRISEKSGINEGAEEKRDKRFQRKS